MVGEGQKDSGTVTSGEVERLDAWMLVRALLRKTEDPRKRVPGKLEMRPSSNAPNPVEYREAPPTSSFPDFSEPP